MFDFVRSHTRLFQFILVILIFPSFVFFGVQGYSSFQDGGNAGVASVDGRKITQSEWDRAHQREGERMRRQMPNIDAKLLDTPEMKKQVLDGLVRERVLLAAAERQHLFPADERLLQKFRTDPQFAAIRNPDGSVNRDLLSAQGMSSEMFAAQLRQDIGMRQVLLAVGGTSSAPKATTGAAVDAWLERREVQVQRFDAREYAAKVKPTDADLAAHFKANEARFRLPEEAKIEYVMLDVETLRKGITVQEDDARRYYAENESRYTRAEERRASHILVKAEKSMSAEERKKAREKAESLLAQVRKTPSTFGDLARKNSDDPGSASRGGDLDFFGRGAMVKAFEDAVFSMKSGEISNLIETEFGFHIIQMTGSRGGEKKPFEAVRAEIEGEIGRQLAQRKFAESAETFTNTVYEQADSLQPVIDKLKLEKRTATVRRTPAPGATGALASAKLLEAVFSGDTLRNKRNTEAVDLGNSQLVSARVVEHVPERVPPLADVIDRVRVAVVQEQAAAQAKKAGEARLAEVKAGSGAALPAAVTVSRAQPQGLPRGVVDAVLQAAPDKLPAVLGVDLGPQGYVVAKVAKVLGRDAADPAGATLAPQVAQAWAAAETELYMEALKKRFKAEVKVGAPAAAASATK